MPYEISFLMLKIFHSFAVLTHVLLLLLLFPTLEEKFHIFAWPCNILYLFVIDITNESCSCLNFLKLGKVTMGRKES